MHLHVALHGSQAVSIKTDQLEIYTNSLVLYIFQKWFIDVFTIFIVSKCITILFLTCEELRKDMLFILANGVNGWHLLGYGIRA